MTPTAFSFTRAQKSCTTSKPTSASSSAVRTSFSASSTVASSSSARPWNRCLADRNPFVSVSNIGRRNLTRHLPKSERALFRVHVLVDVLVHVHDQVFLPARPVSFHHFCHRVRA